MGQGILVWLSFRIQNAKWKRIKVWSEQQQHPFLMSTVDAKKAEKGDRGRECHGSLSPFLFQNCAGVQVCIRKLWEVNTEKDSPKNQKNSNHSKNCNTAGSVSILVRKAFEPFTRKALRTHKVGAVVATLLHLEKHHMFHMCHPLLRLWHLKEVEVCRSERLHVRPVCDFLSVCYTGSQRKKTLVLEDETARK